MNKSRESKPCVLFVEEDEYARIGVSTQLEVWGYEAESASTIREALEKVKQRKYDLILLDWYYEDGTGVELCEAIRSFDAQTAIFFYTGVALEAKLEKATKAGAQGFIGKPIEKDEFMETVNGYIPDQGAVGKGN